jgi:N6-adenosine-specific RNA methylase IME4
MELVKYNEACRAIAEAKNIDEVKTIRDKSEAIRAYAHIAKNKQMEIDATEIRIRSERRLGEMLKQQKETVGLNQGAQGSIVTGTQREPVKDTRPTLAEVGIDKKLSSRAQAIAAVPADEFEGMVDEWRERVQEEGERVTTNLVKRGEMEKAKARVAPEMPSEKYNVIYADPPWKYTSGEQHANTEQKTVIGTHYPSMSLEEICALPISEIADNNAALFLWVTSPLLEESFQVINAWGFKYKTSMVWDKVKHNVGHYVSVRHEFLLICTRGTMPHISKLVDSVYSEERTEHSKKPEYFRTWIKQVYPEGKRVELFARGELPEGWDAWGNEAG